MTAKMFLLLLLLMKMKAMMMEMSSTSELVRRRRAGAKILQRYLRLRLGLGGVGSLAVRVQVVVVGPQIVCDGTGRPMAQLWNLAFTDSLRILTYLSRRLACVSHHARHTANCISTLAHIFSVAAVATAVVEATAAVVAVADGVADGVGVAVVVVVAAAVHAAHWRKTARISPAWRCGVSVMGTRPSRLTVHAVSGIVIVVAVVVAAVVVAGVVTVSNSFWLFLYGEAWRILHRVLQLVIGDLLRRPEAAVGAACLLLPIPMRMLVLALFLQKETVTQLGTEICHSGLRRGLETF
mmetsp:Transcript_22063/g.47032  ORF Transcript_22063/g.47032 Transcript_22063/m.47032 type:complete len:295 (+) Transcript_22063:802-1686(+)